LLGLVAILESHRAGVWQVRQYTSMNLKEEIQQERDKVAAEKEKVDAEQKKKQK
jgi:hypothetical protein